jgi:hypothetical protein
MKFDKVREKSNALSAVVNIPTDCETSHHVYKGKRGHTICREKFSELAESLSMLQQ